MNLRGAVVFLLSGLLLLSAHPAVGDNTAQTDAINVGKLRFGIKNQELLLDQNILEERSLLGELQQLDEQLAVHKAKITDLTEKIRRQETLIAAKTAELTSLMGKNEALRQHLIQRLKAFYMMGRTGFLNVTFSGKTLPDLLLTQDAFQALVTYDRALFKEYRDSVTTLERVKQSSELEKSVLENFLADADQERGALQQVVDEKNSVLKRVRTQKGLYEQALKEMRRAESQMTAKLSTAVPAQDARPLGFALAKGQLSPPLYGAVTRRFQEDGPDVDPTFTNGISIRTAGPSDVFAIAGGTVLFAGVMRGYGKMVIIDHGQQYFSISAHLDEIKVREGSPIKQGQVIGETGATSNLFGGGLYFEIRHDAIAEDPLLWLKPGSLALP
jgi:septal ring factor EnvC (AmiA/AmiB activator)